MSRFFYKGIMLQQQKEPALSRQLREFMDARSIDIRMDGEPFGPPDALTPDDIIALARRAQIFDERDGLLLADKLARAREIGCQLLVVDAIDDEPYISSQINPMLKNPKLSQLGLELCQRTLDAADACFLVYKNLTDIESKILRKIGIYPVIRMRGRYPAEYQASIEYREDAGALMIGAGSVIHLARAALYHKPQTSTFVTVAGDCISTPANLEISLGVTVMQALDRCGLIDNPSRVVLGGSMTGSTINDPETAVVTHTTRAILAFRLTAKKTGYDCIGCGRCITACPLGLNPFMIYRAIRHDRQDMLRRLDANLCISCGACSYMCPSKLNLSKMITDAVSASEEKHAEIAQSYGILQAYKSAIYENYLFNHRFGKAVSAQQAARRRLLRDYNRWQTQATQAHNAVEGDIQRRTNEATAALHNTEREADSALARARQQMNSQRTAAEHKLESVTRARDMIHRDADRVFQRVRRSRRRSEHAAEQMVQQSIDFQNRLSKNAVQEAERALAKLENAKEPTSTELLQNARNTLAQARLKMQQDTQHARSEAEQNCTRTKADILASYSQASVIFQKNKQDADQAVVDAQDERQEVYNRSAEDLIGAEKTCEEAKQAARSLFDALLLVCEKDYAAEQVRFEKVQVVLRRKGLIEQAIIDETLHLARFHALAAAHSAAQAQAAVSARACLPDDYKMPTFLRRSEAVLIAPTLRLSYDREGYPLVGSKDFKRRIEKGLRKLLEMTPEQIAAAIQICTNSLANPPSADELPESDLSSAQTDASPDPAFSAETTTSSIAINTSSSAEDFEQIQQPAFAATAPNETMEEQSL